MRARRELVVVVPDYLPSRGGTTTMAVGLATQSAAAGIPTTVITQRLDPRWPATEAAGGIAVERLGPQERSGPAMKRLVTSVTGRLLRRRDAAILTLMYPDFATAAVIAGAASRTCMVWAGNGDATDALAPGGRAARRALRRARLATLRRVRHIALSDAIAQELGRVGITRGVTVIPTPVDSAHFRPPEPAERAAARAALGLAAGDVVVVYTGHLRALKRVERIVESFAVLHAEGLAQRLLLVGGSRADLDDTTAVVDAAIDHLGVRDAVTLTGAVDEVRPFLWAADIFVLASDREGLSTSLLEAMSCGLACVAPPSAAGDQILDATCGVVPPDNSVESLHDALRTLAADAEHRNRLATGAVERAKQAALPSVAARYHALLGLRPAAD